MENLPLFDGIREEWEARGQVGVLLALLETKFVQYQTVKVGQNRRKATAI